MSMNNTPDSPAKTPDDCTDQGGNYWTLFIPGIWKVLHAVLDSVAPSGVESEMSDGLRDLAWLHAAVEREFQIGWKQSGLIAGDQHGEGDEAAIPWRKLWVLPQAVEKRSACVALKRRRDGSQVANGRRAELALQRQIIRVSGEYSDQG